MLTLARGAWRIGAVLAEKSGHRGDQLAGAIGGGVGPALRLVAFEHDPLRAGQPRQRAARHLPGRAVFAGDHQYPIGDPGKWRRVEPDRRHADNTAEALAMRCRQSRHVARDLAGNMRPPDPEMVEQRDQPVGRW